MNLVHRIAAWLQDHNSFEPLSKRSARRRLKEIMTAYGETNPVIRPDFGSDGQRKGFTSTINEYPEVVEQPSGEVLNEIYAAAAELPYLMQAFLDKSLQSWGPEELDLVFSAWQSSTEKGRFTSEKVIQITGAAFGEYCNLHLKTRWLIVADPSGGGRAIRSPNNRVTAWPFSIVRKRVDDNESAFFVRVYELLRRSVEEADTDGSILKNEPTSSPADNGDLADDFSHPIRQVNIFDTVVTLKGGGAYIGIVIATPLDASRRSILRLKAKSAFYLNGFYSAHGRELWGTPKTGKMSIFINIHPESSPEAFGELQDFLASAAKRGVEVRIQKSLDGPVVDH